MIPEKMRFGGTAVALLIILMAGCGGDYRPSASGPEGHITVAIDSVLWDGPVGEALREWIGGPLVTLPFQEPAFQLEPVGLTSRNALDMIQSRKNVLLVGAIADTTTSESRYIRSLLSDDLRQHILDGQSVSLALADKWRRSQLVYALVAAHPADLATLIEDNAEDLLYHYNLVTRQRWHREMFDIGRQRDLEAELMEKHGFAVNGQHDYYIATDTTQFVWLRRGTSESWRSLFVHYIDGANSSQLTPDWIVGKRDELARKYLQGTDGCWVETDLRRPMEASEIEFNGRFAIELRGMWQMVSLMNGRKVQCGMGGPLLTYTFIDEGSQRLYILDGMVFAPNYPKREFLRHLEVISWTFRTRQEEAERAAT